MEEEPFDGATSGVPFECRSTNILLRCVVACCMRLAMRASNALRRRGFARSWRPVLKFTGSGSMLLSMYLRAWRQVTA